MDSTLQKTRVAKKKSPTMELPQDVVSQYSRLENILSHSLARKWLTYEWHYDEIEDAYFNKCKTFECMMQHKYPQLKVRKLTATEWRRIRKSICTTKIRRFSSKFVHEERIKLEKYRRRYQILQENKRIDGLNRLNAVDGKLVVSTLLENEQPIFEIIRLIVEIQKIFVSKSLSVAKLREFNNNRAEALNSNANDSNENGYSAIKVVANLRDCNTEIMMHLNKLMCYQLVKDAVLFNALSRKSIVLTLSPVYFRRKCAVRIHEDHLDWRSDTIIKSDVTMVVIQLVLTQLLAAIECYLLEANVLDFGSDLAREQLKMLKERRILILENIAYLDGICLPIWFDILKNINGYVY